MGFGPMAIKGIRWPMGRASASAGPGNESSEIPPGGQNWQFQVGGPSIVSPAG
jgi:hypothetical protein